ARRERPRGTEHVVGVEPELGQKRPCWLLRSAEGVEQRRVDGEARTGLLELAEDHPAAGDPAPVCQPQLAGERAEKRRLAASVRAGQGQAITASELEIDRPEAEVSALDHRPLEADDEIAAACRGFQLELELPRLERLLHAVEPLQHPL